MLRFRMVLLSAESLFQIVPKPSQRSMGLEHEIALQPGMVVWTRYLDPATDKGLKLEGEIVVEFPRLREFQTVNLKALRIRTDEHTGQVMVRQGELIARPSALFSWLISVQVPPN